MSSNCYTFHSRVNKNRATELSNNNEIIHEVIQLLFRNDSLCVFDHEPAEDKRTIEKSHNLVGSEFYWYESIWL